MVRNRAGVRPVRLPKIRVKWLCEAKPSSLAMAAIGKERSPSSANEARSRRRLTKRWRLVPVDRRNFRAKWFGERPTRWLALEKVLRTFFQG